MNIRFFFGKVFRWLGKKEFLNFIGDKLYLEICYFLYMGKKVNFSNPVTLNQKINWLKIYDRKNEYCCMVDKFLAKKYVEKIIGKEYIIPTLGVWNNFDDIDFDTLPERFVLKCTHDCGSTFRCLNKKSINYDQLRSHFNKCLKHNFFWLGREWAYKDIKPRIIAEQYLEDDEIKELIDYKFYCFRDFVDSVLVCIGRGNEDTKFYFFDREWNLKRYNKLGKAAPVGFTLPKPKNLKQMFTVAELLSKESEAPFLRVDLYNIKGQIYFGELTFYPDCGMDVNRLSETDEYFGSLVDLTDLQKKVCGEEHD